MKALASGATRDFPGARGGHSLYGGDADVPHIFAGCLCCHPKTPHFLVKFGLFNRSHPKTPYFLHSAATKVEPNMAALGGSPGGRAPW